VNNEQGAMGKDWRLENRDRRPEKRSKFKVQRVGSTEKRTKDQRDERNKWGE